MTALLEKVIAQAKSLPAAEQDAVAARLLETLTEWVREKQPQETPAQDEQAAPKPRPRFGSAKGLGYMTPDFDDPLEEFQEHTQ